MQKIATHIITCLTIFPEYFKSSMNTSIMKRATQNLVRFECINIREFATDTHATTDDRPFGGGPGMVMKVEPIDKAVKAAKERYPGLSRKVILTSAKGALFTQQTAQELSCIEHLIVICGHYEGVDERVAEYIADVELRIGDYILTGGEPATVVIVDAVTRLIPGVLGNPESTIQETHTTPQLGGHPVYTRPATYKDWNVPTELLSGDHAQIATWKEQHRTLKK